MVQYNTTEGGDLKSLLRRQFAFLVSKSTAAADLVRAAAGADKKLITGARVFDVYTGQGVPEDKVSIAIEIVLQPRDKTLTDEDIDQVSNNVVKAVEKAVGGVLRA